MTVAKTRTLLIEFTDGRKGKLTVPESAKLTFGALQPGAAGKGGADWGGSSRFEPGSWLRVYEGVKQTAVLGGIKVFRDMAYPFEVQTEVHEAASDATIVDGTVVASKAKTKREFTWSVSDDGL